jgi:hypothetical protein
MFGQLIMSRTWVKVCNYFTLCPVRWFAVESFTCFYDVLIASLWALFILDICRIVDLTVGYGIFFYKELALSFAVMSQRPLDY